MVRIEQYPIPSGLISLSVATQMTNGLPTALKVKMTAAEELLPTAKDYIENQKMLPEIISLAGLDEDLAISVITEVDHQVVDENHLYTMNLDVANA